MLMYEQHVYSVRVCVCERALCACRMIVGGQWGHRVTDLSTDVITPMRPPI